MQTLAPWLHILSFSVWLCANVFFLGMLLPASRALPRGERSGILRRAGGALNAVTAVAAPMAVASGLGAVFLPGAAAQAAPGSGAFLILVVKTILTAVMAVNHGLQAFRYGEFLGDPLDARNPWMRLLAANAVLGIVVLLLGLVLRRVAM